MKQVRVPTKNPYDVLLGRGILGQLGTQVLSVHKVSKVVIVTDCNVHKLYLKTVKQSLSVAGFDVYEIILEAGEQNKTPQTYLSVIEKMAQLGFGRGDLVVALGGGVVGDIAGFAAATYMRGVDFVQVPTTLLSAIDASVGGKTGVDLPQGKNLLGAFWQPKLVFFDSVTLLTLAKIDWKNGIAEGIKYAILSGGEILEILETGLTENNILRFVELCVCLKRDIVAEDELECGKRKLLNLGHTFGHAIEKLSNFSVSHGVAVAKGIYLVAHSSERAKKLSLLDFERICGLLNIYELDATCDYPLEKLLDVIKMDKKIDSDGEISLIGISSIGNCEIEKMSLSKLEKYINEC